MAYKLQTEIGQATYRLRKCTVEPVIGLITEVLGFRQFSLRGLRLPRASRVGCVWPSISNACIRCGRPEGRLWHAEYPTIGLGQRWTDP
jgi:hypothetical protein